MTVKQVALALGISGGIYVGQRFLRRCLPGAERARARSRSDVVGSPMVALLESESSLTTSSNTTIENRRHGGVRRIWVTLKAFRFAVLELNDSVEKTILIHFVDRQTATYEEHNDLLELNNDYLKTQIRKSEKKVADSRREIAIYEGPFEGLEQSILERLERLDLTSRQQ